jgi:hypothetical protein
MLQWAAAGGRIDNPTRPRLVPKPYVVALLAHPEEEETITLREMILWSLAMILAAYRVLAPHHQPSAPWLMWTAGQKGD